MVAAQSQSSSSVDKAGLLPVFSRKLIDTVGFAGTDGIEIKMDYPNGQSETTAGQTLHGFSLIARFHESLN